MSSLQAQLAALNGTAGKNPGSVFASSTRHSEALGRGLDYSVQQGHAVLGKHGHQPSILHQSSKEAARVPLNLIEENFQHAIESLADFHPSLLDFLDVCGEKVSASRIHNLFVIIGGLIGETNALESCLHVLEYLIRRYRIHREHMEDFLWILLPQSDVVPVIVHRGLQLVDLQANQSYLWLRPYTDPKLLVSIPRSLIAQHVVRRPDLVRTCCRWVREMVQAEERATQGTSHILSFTAAILVEGLAWQKTAINDLPESAQQEVTLRALLPHVLAACQSRVVEWKGWGNVLASTIVETMDLTFDTVAVMTKAVIRTTTSDWEDRVDTLVTVLSILLPPQQQIYDESNYITLFSEKLCGCDLPTNVWEELHQWDNLAEILGHLDQNRVVIAPFLAALVVKASRVTESDELEWISNMIEHSSLREVWLDPQMNLVGSCSAFLVEAVPVGETLPSRRKLLKAFHELDPGLCEYGISKALPTENCPPDLLLPLFDGVVDMDVDTQESVEKSDERVGHLLPPRVALEHAEASVRIGAIERLAKISNESSGGPDWSIQESFVRRWASDDDEVVGDMAGRNVITALNTEDWNLFPQNFDVYVEIVLEGLRHWKAQNSENCQEMGITIAGHLAKLGDESMQSWHRLVVRIYCYLEDKKLAATSAKAILDLVDKKASGRRADDVRTAFNQLVSGPQISVFKELVGTDAVTLVNDESKGQLLWTVAAFFQRNASMSKKSVALADRSLQVCFSIFRSQKKNAVMNDSQNKLLRTCFIQGIEGVSPSRETAVELLVALAGVDGMNLYQAVSIPVIEFLIDQFRTHSPSAVILEAATSTTNDAACLRLVLVATDIVADREQKGWLVLIPALSLLSHKNKQIRRAAVDLISNIGSSLGTSPDAWSMLRIVCDIVSSNSTAACMENQQVLSTMLSQIPNSTTDPVAVRDALLKLSVACVLCKDEVMDQPDGAVELPVGGCASAAFVLNAMESAGEASFPLSARWASCGKMLLEKLLETDSDLPAHVALSEAVVVMLKGVTVRKPAGVRISSGPRSGGGRSRSYSVGRNEGSFIKPYPQEMSEAIVKILHDGRTKTISHQVFEHVLSSASWGESIFRCLSKSVRVDIAREAVRYATSEFSEQSHSLFMMLPLDASDLTSLLSVSERIDSGAVSLLCDFVRAHATKLKSSGTVHRLVAQLYILLEHLCSVAKSGDGGLDFPLRSVSQALCCLWAKDGNVGIAVKSGSNVKKWVETVKTSFELAEEKQMSYKTRSVTLELLLSMCTISPQNTLDSLHAVIIQAITLAKSDIAEGSRLLGQTLPTFFGETANAGSMLINLFDDICRTTKDLHPKLRSKLLTVVAKGLVERGKLTKEQHLSVPGTLIATLLVSEDAVSMAKEVVKNVSVRAQVMSVLAIVDYSKSCLSKILNNVPHESMLPNIPSIEHILKQRGMDRAQKTTLCNVVLRLVTTVNEVLLTDAIQRFVRQSHRIDAAMCLRMWQDLLVLQSVTSNAEDDDSETWSTLAEAVNSSRESLQSLLPIHLFLEAIVSLLKDAESDDLRARALKLLVDRINETDPESQDASSIVDMMPHVTLILKDKGQKDAKSLLVCQAALVTVEHIARLFPKESTKDKKVHHLLSALGRATELLDEPVRCLSDGGGTLRSISGPLLQIVASVALSADTLVRATGARSIATLPKLVRRISACLLATNRSITEADTDDDSNLLLQAKVIQVAILRALSAIAETVPQFLSAHFNSLFTESALFSDALRESADSGVKAAVERLDVALAGGTPARLLIPALLKVCTRPLSPTSLLAILKALSDSVVKTKGVEAVAMKGLVLKVVTLAFEYQAEPETRFKIVEAASRPFLSLVMKLSEIQLRQIITSFQDWRGDFDPKTSELNSHQRYCFWKVSGLLAKELGSLFLPCVGSFMDDIIAELEFASDQLNRAATSAAKRRKLDNGTALLYSEASMCALQPLLGFLEHVLRADARDGGQWVRADVEKRYHAILAPLGKLFTAKIPNNFPVQRQVQDAYSHVLYGGHDEEGNVVSCLSALANAAGTEELWKPMNFCVLEACSFEGRSQVRRAGLECLASLIKSIGEEYMVLLPECLPVLSELLEDSNEDIAGLARECISISEELLGESLEESLR